jgi:hypothetical protein
MEHQAEISLDLYKTLLLVALYRAGGEIKVTADEIDEIRAVTKSMKLGVVGENTIVVRAVVESDAK